MTGPLEPRIAALAFFLCWSAWRLATLISEVQAVDKKDITPAGGTESNLRIIGMFAWIVAITFLIRWCFI